MPLGIVSTDDYERELVVQQSPVVLTKPIIHGRNGSSAVPAALQKLISQDAIEGNGTQKEIAAIHNVSPSSVSAYKHGAASTSSYHSPKQELADHNKQVRTEITNKANGVVTNALNALLREGVLDGVKPRDVAGIARDISTISKNINPDNGVVMGDHNQVVIFKPRMKEEDEYKVIDVQ